MKKQIKKKSEALITPLRLTSEEAIILQQLREYLNESTRNGTVVKAIVNYKKNCIKLNEALNNESALKNQLLKLREFFKTMQDAEAEIKNILNLK